MKVERPCFELGAAELLDRLEELCDLSTLTQDKYERAAHWRDRLALIGECKAELLLRLLMVRNLGE